MPDRMICRSHFDTFLTLRNKASKYRSFNRYSDGVDEERITLVDNDDLACNQNDGAPYWMSIVERFRVESARICRQIDDLGQLQDASIRTKQRQIFDEGNDSPDQELENRSQEISHQLSRLHQLVNETRNVSKTDAILRRLLNNITHWQCRVLSNLTVKLRSVQRTYIRRVQEYDDYMAKFAGDEAIDELNDVDLFDPVDTRQSHPLQQIQVQTQIEDHQFLKQREQEMAVIFKSMDELNQIFQDINATVINQGSMLDRIDYNIENVEFNVKAGVSELAEAEKSVRKSRKIKLIIFMTLFLIFLLVVINIGS